MDGEQRKRLDEQGYLLLPGVLTLGQLVAVIARAEALCDDKSA